MTTSTAERAGVRWQPLEPASAPAFAFAGVLTLASAVAPDVVGSVTDWAAAVGVAFAGFAVLAAAAGMLGLYPRVAGGAPRLAGAGAVAAAVAGASALVMAAVVSAIVAGDVLAGVSLPRPMSVFAALAGAMAGGFALGLLAFGAAAWRAGAPSRTVGALLLVGGALLVAPVAGAVVGVETPHSMVHAVLLLVGGDSLAVAYRLRADRRAA
jgi:hypothetical protein